MDSDAEVVLLAPVVLCLYLVVGPRAGGWESSFPGSYRLCLHDGMLPPYGWKPHGIACPLLVERVTHDMHGRPVYLPSERRGDVTVHVLPAAGVLTPGQGVHLDIRVEPADRPVYPVVYLLFQQA